MRGRKALQGDGQPPGEVVPKRSYTADPACTYNGTVNTRLQIRTSEALSVRIPVMQVMTGRRAELIQKVKFQLEKQVCSETPAVST